MPTWSLWTAVVLLASVVGYAFGRIHEREKAEEQREIDRYLNQLERQFEES